MTTHTTQREADERAKFEAHMRDQGASSDDLKTPHGDGRYFWEKTADAWSIWQARAAIAQGASPASLALPTDDEVYAEMERLRDKHHCYVSFDAASDVMQAYRSLLTSTRAAPEAPTLTPDEFARALALLNQFDQHVFLSPEDKALKGKLAEAAPEAPVLPRALREVRRQQIDPKLGTTGATAYARFLYAELARLQAAVIADCESAGAAPEAPDSEQQASDPMNWPLPCDIKVGAVTIRKGCGLRTLVARMESLQRMAMKALPEPTPEARALIDAMIRGEDVPAMPLLNNGTREQQLENVARAGVDDLIRLHAALGFSEDETIDADKMIERIAALAATEKGPTA